jgi:methyl-accepting chemotaxis protein
MKTELTELLNAGEGLITRIEETRDGIERELAELGGTANEIDTAIHELAAAADDLHGKIVDIRKAAPHVHDAIAAATVEAIDNLIRLLSEAKTYFAAGERLAAFGTLTMFDQHADDLRAAFRLCQMAQRRPS